MSGHSATAGSPPSRWPSGSPPSCGPRGSRSSWRSTTCACPTPSAPSSPRSCARQRGAGSRCASSTTSTTRTMAQPGPRRCTRRPRRDPRYSRRLPDRGPPRPRRARPDAPQVRRSRRRSGLDRLGELDHRLLDPPGERARRGPEPRGRRGLPRQLRGALAAPGRGAQRPARARAGRGGETAGPRVVLPGPGRDLSHAIAKAIGRARSRVRIASPVITSAARARHACGARPTAGWMSPAWSMPPRSRLRVRASGPRTASRAWKIPLLAAVLSKPPFSGKRSISVAGGGRRSPQLHARQGHRRRRRRLDRPSNFSRYSERERPRDSRRADSGHLAAFVEPVRAVRRWSSSPPRSPRDHRGSAICEILRRSPGPRYKQLERVQRRRPHRDRCRPAHHPVVDYCRYLDRGIACNSIKVRQRKRGGSNNERLITPGEEIMELNLYLTIQ